MRGGLWKQFQYILSECIRRRRKSRYFGVLGITFHQKKMRIKKTYFRWRYLGLLPKKCLKSEILYKELKHSLYKTYKGNASIPYINSKVPRFRIFWEFFHLEKNISKFFWTPMSIQNFPSIPKITLIKLWNHFK